MKMIEWRWIAPLLCCAALVPCAASAAMPTFTSQPADVAVIPGQDARFDASSTDELSSQWQVSSDNGQTWRALPSPYFAHLVVPAVSLADNGKLYRRRLFNSPDEAVSRAATLTVQASSPRRLALLAGGLGGSGSSVDNLVGNNLRFFQPGWLSVDADGNVYLGQFTVALKIDASRRAQSLAGRKNSTGARNGKGGAATFGEIQGSVPGANGEVYIVDRFANLIRKIAIDGTVTTVAGSGYPAHADGKGRAASFYQPTGIARDAAGNLYVADTDNHVIRKITPAGVVTTWAGKPGVPGSGGTTVDDAQFNRPQGVAFSPDGSLYVTDTDNHVIRRISQAGFVAKIAGAYGVPGSSDGIAAAAHFNSPKGIAVNSQGEIFVADSKNHTIRKIVGNAVTTLAGSPGIPGSADGAASGARFERPTGLALNLSGNLLVGDASNATIRRVTMAGEVTTWAGRTSQLASVDGLGGEARFADPRGLAVDAEGNVYVAELATASVRKVTSAGVASTVTSLGRPGHTAEAVAIDASGNVLVTDSLSCVVLRVSPQGVTTLIAGQQGDCRYVNGRGTNARFVSPSGITVDALGNIFVADGPLIRKISPSLDVSRYAGANSTEPARDGTVTTARFLGASALVFDSAGNLFLADVGAIRKITPAGAVTTLAGALNDSSGLIDGQGGEARFTMLHGLTIDPSGNLYAADSGSNAIRKITPGGAVTTILGTHDMATVVLGGNPLVNGPQGVAMIDATHLAISAENAILIYTLP